ncbi:hypothetical protein GCM10009592_01780 [Brachybacterium rhamnosum]|uniref:Integral membrane protein n=1 Tax=Brachybacterium rhamnosum TaxID=173361 RepID=A0ABW4PTT6_9MICO|nr:hypothetical protein [Brachybacterium sp. SGAir0954]
MTETPGTSPRVEGTADSCAATPQDPHTAHDPHDHSDHDHPPTGADLVRDLVRGLSVVALLIPVVIVVLLLTILPMAPSTPLPLVLGLALGAAHLLSLVVTSLFVSRTRRQLAVNPGLLAVRSAVDELLRVAAVLLGLLLWPGELRGELGVWIGAGAAIVWLVLATTQTVSTRRRIASPSQWAEDAVATLLHHRVGARSTVVMRLLDVIGTACFQVGATVLVILSPVLVIGTAVLSIGSGLSTLVLQRRPPAERAGTAWAYVPLGVGVLTLLLAVLGLATA